VYRQGTAGQGGTFAFSGIANVASEPAVATACNSTGSNYRFWLPIPHTLTQSYGGQTIYIHGISPFGLPNNAINNSGNLTIPSVDRSVTGNIEGVSQQGNDYYLNGWACAKTQPGSIEVQVFAGGPPGGGGTFVVSAMANQSSDGGIAAACNSTGSSYRFSILLSVSVRLQFGTQPIYVRGMSPFGLSDLLIANSGNFTIPIVDRSITGNIETISQQGSNHYLNGWACARTHLNSIDVQVFAGGASGSGGTFVVSATANQPSDGSIATACNSTGTNYRFSILLSLPMRQQFNGQPIYVHGMSPFGLPNLLIGNSGTFNVPSPYGSSSREYIYLGDRVLAVETTNLP
jgi:hypothetical protein